MQIAAIQTQITQLCEAWLTEQPHLFLLAVEVKGGRVGHKVTVLLDGDQGVDLDSCTALSRHVSGALQEDDPFPGAWNLEVSSPGVDYPLTSERQYRKNIGRQIKVTLTDGKTLEGPLKAVSPDHITLDITTKEKGKKPVTAPEVLPMGQIKKTQIIISFK